MSTPPLLVVRYRNGSAQVGRLLGGTTFKQLGNDLPGGVESPTATTSMTNCRAAQFKSKVYAYQRDRIYRFDEGTTNDWTEVHQAVSQDSTTGFAFHSGIHVVQINNVPTMVAFYRHTPNFDLQALHSTDGTTWTLFDTNTSTGTNLVGRSFVFRNDVYIWFNHLAIPGLLKYDPITKVATILTTDSVWVAGFAKDFCVFNNELYGIGPSITLDNGIFNLKKLVGSQFTQVQAISGAHLTINGGATNSAPILFSDGANIYAFLPGRDVGLQNGTTAVQLAPNGATFIETDISANVLPTSVRPPVGAIHYWHSFLDNDTDPENPDITIWSQVPDGNSSYNAWQWNGPLSLITNIGPGPDAGLALPHTKDGGGEYIWTSKEPSVEITDISPNVDSQTISFIAYSSEVTNTFRVRLWYGSNEKFANSPATLVGPVTGGGVLGTDTIGDFVDDVTADGITVHTVVWDVVTDGHAKGSSVILMPSISL